MTHKITGTFETMKWPSDPPEGCPLERSRDMVGVEFLGRYAVYTKADTWYPSWGSDDVLYSTFTDGQADQIASMSVGRHAMTGHARITGSDPLELDVEPLGTNFGNPGIYGGRYPSASLMHDGIWYYGTYCLDETPNTDLNWDVMGPFVGFRISRDKGITWEETTHTSESPLFGESGKGTSQVKMGAPHFVDFGKNMQHSPDGKAYIVAHGGVNPEGNISWVSGDHVYLARTDPSPETIDESESWEFYSGNDESGSPRWVSDVDEAKPLINWPGHTGTTTITYNEALNKYIMCVTDGWPTVGPMSSYFLESDTLTGPYRLISYLKNFGLQAYFLNIPSKFISADGARMWLCYSGNFTLANGVPVGQEMWDAPESELYEEVPPGSKYGMVLQEMSFAFDTRD